MVSRFNIHPTLNDDDREAALTFITQVAQKSYNCEPPPVPEIILAAWLDEQVVGTMSLDFGGPDKPLPLEDYWEFDQSQTPFPYIREKIVQFGRWMTTLRDVSIALVYAAANWSYKNGKDYVFFEAKKSVAGHLCLLGIPVQKIQQAHLALDRIPLAGRGYYVTPPPPSLYMVGVSEVIKACLTKEPVLERCSF